MGSSLQVLVKIRNYCIDMASIQFSVGDVYNAYTGHFLNKDITEYQVETIEDFIEDGLVVAGDCDLGDDNQQHQDMSEIQIECIEELIADGMVTGEVFMKEKDAVLDKSEAEIRLKDYDITKETGECLPDKRKHSTIARKAKSFRSIPVTLILIGNQLKFKKEVTAYFKHKSQDGLKKFLKIFQKV